MRLVNLTPHSINFVTNDGTPIITIKPSGTIARVTARTVTVGDVEVTGGETTVMHGEFECPDGTIAPMYSCTVPITGTIYGEVENLPAPEVGTVYIVSSLVAQRCRDRDDVFITNESVRDENGRIIGCRSLGRV